MVEYLEQLVASGEYRQALAYAEQLLGQRPQDLKEWLVINSAMLKSRVELGEYSGALVSGQLAVKLARDLDEWDYFGEAAFLLGATHYWMRQTETAIAYCYEYLANVPKYGSARKYEALVQYNLGLYLVKAARAEDALKALYSALTIFERTNRPRQAHGVRHALIKAHMEFRQSEQVPALLVQCGHYLRTSPQEQDIKMSWLWHYLLRAEFALRTGRLERAQLIAARGLRLSLRQPLLQFYFCMLLARIARRKGAATEALSRSLSARVFAIHCNRFDLESDAADFMYEITKVHPNAALHLEHEIPSPGIDLASYDLVR